MNLQGRPKHGPQEKRFSNFKLLFERVYLRGTAIKKHEADVTRYLEPAQSSAILWESMALLSRFSAPPYFETRDISIYRGDCRELLRTLPDESIDFVLTDPPYLVSYRGRWGSDWEPVKGDDEASWVLPAFVEIWRVLKANSLCLSFYGWPSADLFLNAWRLIGFRPVSHLVCVKEQIGLGCYTRSQHESAFLLAKGNPPRPAAATGDVFSWRRELPALHPNQKPLGTIARLISSYTLEGQIVLDPFMGSGTTLLAARNLGRRAIGIEIEEQYCEVAVKRLAQEIFDFGQTPASLTQVALTLEHPEDHGQP